MSIALDGQPLVIETAPPLAYEQTRPLDAGAQEYTESWLPTMGQAGTALVLGAATVADVVYVRPSGITDNLHGVAYASATSFDHLIVGALGAYVGYKRQIVGKKVGEVTSALYEKAFKYAVISTTALNFEVESAQALVKSSPEKFFLKPENWGETFKDYIVALGAISIFYGQKKLAKTRNNRTERKVHSTN